MWLVGGNIAPYLLFAGLDKYLVLYICIWINVIINSYVGVPLMHAQFGDWLATRDNFKWSSNNSPDSFFLMNGVRTVFDIFAEYFDSGFPIYVKYFIVIVYFTLNVLFGFLNSEE